MAAEPKLSGARTARRVLIASTELWFATARLAMAFAKFGCEVCLLAPAQHPALLTGSVAVFRRHRPLRPLEALCGAIYELKPDAVIPADERMVLLLQELWVDEAKHRRGEVSWLNQLLTRSFGSREALFAARSRLRVLQIAKEQGSPIPDTICVDREEDLVAASETLGFPLVLKADMTSGGNGVALVHDMEEARRSWKKLHLPPNILRVVRRGILFKNWDHMRSWRKRTSLGVTAQRFVKGSERTSMAVCLNGEVLASVCLEVARTWLVRGPSSVLRLVQDESMTAAMRRVAKELSLSGFCGFDFMVPKETGQSVLIEMNPRPTQTVHLALGAGCDLIAAYLRSVLGLTEIKDRPAISNGEMIALFPQELKRDIASDLVQRAYHDVPWEAPRLMQRALDPLPALITSDPRWRG